MTKDKLIELAQVGMGIHSPNTPEYVVCEALIKALAQQEPVAWRAWVSKFPQGTGSDWVYVTKPIMKDSVHNQPLYTTQPQRTWVGLTDEEAAECWTYNDRTSWRNIEAKLKEKNT